MTRIKVILYLGIIAVLLLIAVGWYAWAFQYERSNSSSSFDGERAYQDVKTQVAFGPRIPGTRSHSETLDWIRAQLEAAGWHVEIQQTQSMGHPIRNVRAYRSEADPQILLGAHYDSRIFANHDPDPEKWNQPVPGANDGASGVSVLLELARTLPRDSIPVWLVFFDAEDNGGIPGWDWILGSRAFVASMTVRPREMVLVDMVGDADLRIPLEGNSDPALRQSIWDTAFKLGYSSVFVDHAEHTIEDDHVPFIEAGIPTVDIIDLDYAYWHTTSDTPEHVSARSLQTVGDVLLAWLQQQSP